MSACQVELVATKAAIQRDEEHDELQSSPNQYVVQRILIHSKGKMERLSSRNMCNRTGRP
eukprot:15123583-Alexandrium_andersonii.AAC.1